MDIVLKLGRYEAEYMAATEQLRQQRIIERIWQHDHTVWKPFPNEITNRLGWLHAPEHMKQHIAHIESFVDEVRREGMTHALLLGMGGSSLAPEVFRAVFGVKPGYLDLAVLDSTVPGAVLSYARRLDPLRTLFIASTKSGGTVETISLTQYFYAHVQQALGNELAGRHFIAITDPGSGLESLAKQWKFRKIFLNDPNVGGRFSALTLFGLVPAGIVGIDLTRLLDRAHAMAQLCLQSPEKNPGAIFGAAIGRLACVGRDKITFLLSSSLTPLGAWIEQLIAESTGKEGTGIVPIIGEAMQDAMTYSHDRLFVFITMASEDYDEQQVNELMAAGHPVIKIVLNDRYDLGAELFRWEMATAVACYFLGVNPFDQPNVESAKALARQMISSYQRTNQLPDAEPTAVVDDIKIWSAKPVNGMNEAIRQLMDQANLGHNGRGRSYVAIQAFLAPTAETDAALQKLRTAIQQKYQLATTVGYGPRFLHSTGQLHKGDAGNGLFIQITAAGDEDAFIPNPPGDSTKRIRFGTLALAQALGDYEALRAAQRKVVRFHLAGNIIRGIDAITSSI